MADHDPRRPFQIGRPVPPALDLRARRLPPGQGGNVGPGYSGADLQREVTEADIADFIAAMPEEQVSRFLKAIRKQGHMIMKPIVVGAAAINLLPQQEGRYYLILINSSGVNRMFVGLDVMPAIGFGVPLEINFGFWEPWVVPDNEINIIAAGAGTTGTCVYASL